MQIEYTKVATEKFKNCYVIRVEFEHGDADSYTSYEVKLQDFSKEDFIEYVKKFNDVANQIDESRSTGSVLPSTIKENSYKGKYIPVELDAYAKMNMSGYYASMGIGNIDYYDFQGEKFLVNIK